MKSLYHTVSSLRSTPSGLLLSVFVVAVLGMLESVAQVTEPGGEAHAAVTEKDRFAASLDRLNGVVSQFEQQIIDAQGYVIETSSGTLHLDKPNFRWEVEPPFAQIIVADGQDVRIYDPDLAQVTQRRVAEDEAQTPLTLLTRNSSAVMDDFQIVALDDIEGLVRYVLVPATNDDGTSNLFARLEMAFEGDDLVELVIFDIAGQRTVITFHEFRKGQVIQSGTFQLQLPSDVDIVRG